MECVIYTVPFPYHHLRFVQTMETELQILWMIALPK
jgi:hypothetical protein